MKNPLRCHPEEVPIHCIGTDEGSLYLLDSIPHIGIEILRVVYPPFDPACRSLPAVGRAGSERRLPSIFHHPVGP
jgi:hypothetical protein